MARRRSPAGPTTTQPLWLRGRGTQGTRSFYRSPSKRSSSRLRPLPANWKISTRLTTRGRKLPDTRLHVRAEWVGRPVVHPRPSFRRHFERLVPASPL